MSAGRCGSFSNGVSGLPGGGGDDRQLVLDRRRDRGGGLRPRLVHARKAKLMMGEINKTDRLDVRGLNRLQQAGTLPTVWIPPGELRDQRDLPRTRMVLVRQRTQLKNRIHATLAKYALHDLEVTDLFGVRGRRPAAAPRSLTPAH